MRFVPIKSEEQQAAAMVFRGRDLLVRQVTGMVRWRECMLEAVAIGVTSVVELGAGKVLSGLAKRIDPELRTASAGSPEEIEALLKVI